LIDDILDMLDIHHNIHIYHWNRVPDEVDWITIAEDCIADFQYCWEAEHKSITNNNSYDKDKRNDGIWQYGRSGATLYWQKYWGPWGAGEGNLYVLLIYDEDESYEGDYQKVHCRGEIFRPNLKALSWKELKEIHKELREFTEAVEQLMEEFYSACESAGKQIEEDKELREDALKGANGLVDQAISRMWNVGFTAREIREKLGVEV